VVDGRANVLEAGSETNDMPYPGICDQHGDAYSALVGLNLFKGFRVGVKERLDGVRGCTHLTELTQVLPTALVQALAGNASSVPDQGESARRPFQIDRCHALRSDGTVVRTFHARWYRARPSGVGAPAATTHHEPKPESTT
jgi:hypothetical protein